MNSSTEIQIRKIERVSRFLRAVCTALFIPIVVFGLFAIVSILAGWTAHIRFDGRTFVPSELAWPARVILATAVLAAAAVSAKSLHHLRQLMGNYARREIFTLDSARHIRQFGITCVLWGVVKLGWAFLPLLVTQVQQTVNLTGDTIVIGLVIVGLSWFAELASALREENDLTV
jgi:small-conductance mechanosensitive channel